MHIGAVFPQVEIGREHRGRAQGVEGTGYRLAFVTADSARPTAGTLPPPCRYDATAASHPERHR